MNVILNFSRHPFQIFLITLFRCLSAYKFDFSTFPPRCWKWKWQSCSRIFKRFRTIHIYHAFFSSKWQKVFNLYFHTVKFSASSAWWHILSNLKFYTYITNFILILPILHLYYLFYTYIFKFQIWVLFASWHLKILPILYIYCLFHTFIIKY